MAAIYSVYTSPQHAPIPGHLPTLIVTPHGQPNQILYTYLHTEENRVNYLLTPSPQGDLCVAKLFPPSNNSAQNSSSSLPNSSKQPKPHNVVRCEASRDLRWTIENTGVMSPIYKIVNQDDTPLYQISKPNPNADFWTMFYFKYAGHQIPPRRIEFGKISKNPPERGGGTRISITGRSEDEKQVWQTLGIGNEDCVEWVVCCAVLNLLDDEILRHAEKKNAPNPAAPAATAPVIARGGRSGNRGLGAGIASTAPPSGPPAANLAQAYRQNPPPQIARIPPGQPGSAYRNPPQQQQQPGYGRPPPGGPSPQQQQQQPQQQQRNGFFNRPSPAATAGGRRF